MSPPVSLKTPKGVDRIDVESAAEMNQAVRAALPADAAVMVAANLIRADRPERALTWLDRAEQADPSNVDIYVNRVAALGDLKRYDEAEIAFYLGQERDPEHAELYATMADCLLARRNYDKAVWCLREAARLAPDLQGMQAR